MKKRRTKKRKNRMIKKVETPKDPEVKEENKEKAKPKAPPIQLDEPPVLYL